MLATVQVIDRRAPLLAVVGLPVAGQSEQAVVAARPDFEVDIRAPSPSRDVVVAVAVHVPGDGKVFRSVPVEEAAFGGDIGEQALRLPPRVGAPSFGCSIARTYRSSLVY